MYNIDDSKAIEAAVEMINGGTAGCVVIREGKIIKTELERGIKPILNMYESGLLHDAIVVDKVVGKAAAMVMALGSISYCHALTMSRHAKDFFNSRNIECSCDVLTDCIMNRAGDGMCPMEQAVMGIDDACDGLNAIKNRLAKLTDNK